MQSLVIYDSEFGNTEKVARAIGVALEARVCSAKAMDPTTLPRVGLLVVGGPTQSLGMRETLVSFLAAIPDNALKGVNVAAFDTRIAIEEIEGTAARVAMRIFLHRYAAAPIAKILKAKGGRLLLDPEGFYVTDTEGPLQDGELDRATAWAKRLLEQV